MNYKVLLSALLLMGTATAQAKTVDELRIYINPGHGSWTGNDRPMQVIGKEKYSATNTDTTGFFETNTNLYKGFGMLEKLIEMGFPFDRTRNQTGERWEIGAARDLEQNLVMSRVKNGPFEDNNTTSSENYMLYNRNLLEIATEVEHNEFDQFVSIHSNAATTGSTVNYHLFMYRGRNGKENVLAPGSWEMAEAAAKYSFPNPHAAWSATYTYINGDIDFMSSDKTGSTNELGYYGYLGVLKHGTPGYLVEGYFHTYLPATHRGMNFDVDFVEGMQYARGVAEYFNLEKRDGTGEIYGIVRDEHERFAHELYKPNPITDDIYLPLNGATASLFKDGAKVAEYTTDNFYNGAFVFTGLEPGKYTVTLTHPDYKECEPIEVEVTAGLTSYPKVFLEATDYEPPTDVPTIYPDYLSQLGSIAPADEYTMSTEYTDVAIPELEGKIIRRTFIYNHKMYILALDKAIEYVAAVPVDDQAKATLIVYDLDKKEIITTVSTEGTSGSIAPISDIQITADGYLLACNATKNQYDDGQIQTGDAGRGTFYIYKWNNDENGVPTGNPISWISTKNSALWYRAYPTRFVYTGTALEGQVVVPMPTVTGPTYNSRALTMMIMDGKAQSIVDYKPTNVPALGNYGEDLNMFPNPVDETSAIMLDSKIGISSWSFNSPFDGAITGNDAFTGIDGRAGMFKYAGAAYLVSPENVDGTNSGVKLINMTENIHQAKVTPINLDAPIEAVAAEATSAAGETEVERDYMGTVTGGWMNIYLLRNGKLTKLTTKNVKQPQGRREFAYGLSMEKKDDIFEFTFKMTGDAPEANLVLTPEEGEAITIPMGAVEHGENYFTVAKSDLLPDSKYSWAIEVVSTAIPQMGLIKSEASGLTVRGGVITITDPEYDSFGYTAVGHGNNQGIDIYDPEGNLVSSRLFVGHKLFGGENGSNGKSNQSNPFRGNERNGYAVFSTWGDAGYGMVAINPVNGDEEPFTLFAGEKQSGGHFINNGAILGGGNAGFTFVGTGDDTHVISFSEDHEGKNGKGDTENGLVKYHLGSGWQITEAPEVLGFKNLLANQNVDLCTWGDGVFAAQIREVENNQPACPAFAYISNVLTDPKVTMTGADADIIANVLHSSTGIAISADGKTLAVSYRTAIGIFDVEWNEGVPALTFKFNYPVESNTWAHMRFDAAGNLHTYLREGGYRVYSLPSARPVATTAARHDMLIDTESGVEEISAADAAAADAVYYNLQGVRVDAQSLTPGVYVKVAGSSASKVLIK